MQTILGNTVHGLREFVKRCKKADVKAKRLNKSPPAMPFYERPRQSTRVSTSTFTPETIIAEFTGLPPQRARVWTKEAIVLLIDNLTTISHPVWPFLIKIIKK